MHTAGPPGQRFLKENSKRRTKIHSRLTRVSKDFKDINIDPKALLIQFLFFMKTKLFINYAWLRRTNAQKFFRNLTFVVQFAYFCIGPNKRREQLKVFLVFLSNFRYKKQLLPFFNDFLATF